MALTDSVKTPNVSSRTARNVAGIVFLIALASGAVSGIWQIVTGGTSQLAKHWTIAQIIQGDAAQSLAAEVAHAPVPAVLADAERAMSWLLAGSLGPRVRQGCGHWLFLVDELVVHPGAAYNANARLEAVVTIRDHLRRRGIELVIATVPDKSRVQHAQLCDVYRPVSFQPRLSAWEADLDKRGVRHATLLPALDSLTEGVTPFLKTDTHWSEAGARAAALAVAATVREIEIELSPHQGYVLEPGEPQAREGDLVRLAGIDWMPIALRPPLDMVYSTRFSTEKPTSQASGMAAFDPNDTAADLFGDTNLPSVALMGTSYSETSSFVPFLEAILETPIPTFALEGGDFWRAAKAYLTAVEFRETPPRVVIWEIPERVLQMPIDPEEQGWMKGLESTL